MIFAFDQYVLDPERRELRRGEAAVPVQPQVFDLLEYLIRHRSRLVTRDDLIGAVWGGRIVSESTLATRINAARVAIGDDGEQQRLIRTLPRKGLRFVGDVHEFRTPPPAQHQPAAAPAAATPGIAREAERRQLTVLSCDFPGLRELATQVDPEELSTVLGLCQACCSQVADHWGGALARFADEATTIQFSYPQAHEDDPERAVRAGLELLDRIAQLETREGSHLSARVGLATGLAVVGGTGSGPAQNATAVGEAPTLAAALRRVAAPGTVLITAGTHGLVGGLFEYEQLGPFALEGFSHPVPAWRVVRPSAVESRFEARRNTGLTPFIGRNDEIETLSRRWREAKAGKGRVILVSGDPAMGKSRIAAQFADKLAGREQFTRLLCQCSPHHRDSALHPFIAQLERAAVLLPDDPAARRLDKLEAAIAIPAPHRKSALPLLAALLSIPAADRYTPPALSPLQQRRQTLAALLDQLEGLARRMPVLLVFEDAHWSDPTSIELLDLMMERIQRLPVLALITFRPEFEAPWAGLPIASTLALERLNAQETRAMVEKLAEGHGLSADVLDQIVVKTDGVPLFIEELTKNVVESQTTQPRADVAVTSQPPLSIPSTLEATLRARIDRLSSVKDAAQVGAAIGRSFPYKIIAAIMAQDAGRDADQDADPGTDAALRQALDRLVEAKLILQQGMPPDAVYTFKHALVQDAAYESLLRSQRHDLHARIVAVIENRFPETADSQPELLAYHCSRADLGAKAVAYWLKAGSMAVSRSANLEAINHLHNGLAQLESVASEQDRAGMELALHLMLGQALIAARGYTADETALAFERAGALVDRIGDAGQRYSVLYGIFVGHLIAGRITSASETIERMYRLADTAGDEAYLCLVYRLWGGLSFFHGDLRAAREQLEKSIALYGPEMQQRLGLHFGPDSKAAAQIFLAMTQWLQGLPESASRSAQSAVARVRELNNALAIGQVLTLAAQLHYMAGDYDRMAEFSREGDETCERVGIRYFGAICRLFRIWAAAWRTRPAEHVAEFRLALKAYEDMGCGLQRNLFYAMLARLMLAAARHDEAVAATETAVALSADGEQWWLPEIHRTLGEALRAGKKPDLATAEKCFRHALDEAKQMGALTLELRAGTGLAAMLSERGGKAEARQILAPIVARFREGLDSADLGAAKAVLAGEAAPSRPPKRKR